MLNQSGESRVDTIVKLVLIFFISLLSFSVGVFVGGQVAESDYRAKALESDDYGNFRSTASAKDSHKVSEEELENLTNEFLAGDKKPDGHHEASSDHHKKDTGDSPGHKTAKVDGFEKLNRKHSKGRPSHAKADHSDHADKTAASAHKNVKHKAGGHDSSGHETSAAKNSGHKSSDTHAAKKMDPIKSAANFVANNMAPTDSPKKKRKPSSVLPGLGTSTIGKYTVQVGSYSSEKEAENYASSLKGKGFSAFYVPAQVRGRTWYRVSVGLFNNQKSAASFQKELQGQTKIKSSLVQKIIR